MGQGNFWVVLKSFLKIFFLVLAGAALLIGVAVGGRSYLAHWGRVERALPAPVEVELLRAESLRSFSKKLERVGLIDSALRYEYWSKLFDSYDLYKAGLYRFEGASSPEQVAATVRAGNVYTPLVLQIAVPEGFTVRQVAQRLSAAGIGSVEEVLKLSHDQEFLRSLSIPSTSLEGFLYPATYPFSKIPKPEEALRVMVTTFWRELPTNYQSRVVDAGMTMLEAVTIASLIELETGQDDERSMISEVIHNRLERGMALGIDAAIIYGIEDYRGDLTFKHLKDPLNRYNTRIYTGLPPTPIGAPSKRSLEAVLTPTRLGNLYYVVDGDDLTRHRFAKTNAEHNRNVQKYLAGLRKRRSVKEPAHEEPGESLVNQ